MYRAVHRICLRLILRPDFADFIVVLAGEALAVGDQDRVPLLVFELPDEVSGGDDGLQSLKAVE